MGHKFIRFPKNVQNIDFSKERNSIRGSIESRTSDGLEVVIEISFQYVLQPENLYKLYTKYGPKYHLVLENVAIDILTQEATKYTAYEFFWDRGRINDDFKNYLDKQFSAICFSNIQFLQLRSVDLPNLFENSIQESEVKKQDIKKALAELNKVTVEVDTKIKSALFQQNVTINIAEGEAMALIKQNMAQTDSLQKIQSSQMDGYKILKKNLGLNNNNLLQFIKTKMIKNYDGNNIVLSLQTPEKNLNSTKK